MAFDPSTAKIETQKSFDPSTAKLEKPFTDPVNASEAFNVNPYDIYDDEFTSEKWELDQATLYYMNKYGINPTPEETMANIEIDYGKGATPAQANYHNRKSRRSRDSMIALGKTLQALPFGIPQGIKNLTEFSEGFYQVIGLREPIKTIPDIPRPKAGASDEEVSEFWKKVNFIKDPDQYRAASIFFDPILYFNNAISEIEKENPNFAQENYEKGRQLELEAQELEQLYVIKPEISFEEAFKNGQWDIVGNRIANGLYFQLPNFGVQLGIGFITKSGSLSALYMGTTSASRSHLSMDDNSSLDKKVLQPILDGSIEVISERLGTGAIIDKVVKREIKDSASKTLVRNTIEGITRGASSESGATLGQNLVAKGFGENVGLADNLGLSAVLGAIMDGGTSFTATGFTLGDINRINQQSTPMDIDSLIKSDPFVADDETAIQLAEKMFADPKQENVDAFYNYMDNKYESIINKAIEEGKDETLTPEEIKGVRDGQYDAQIESIATDNNISIEAAREVYIQALTRSSIDLDTQVKNLTKAISEISPETKIIVHETHDKYIEATGKTESGGLYNPETNTIHISKEKRNERTVAHEAFHAILLRNIKTNEEAQKLADNLYKRISRTSNKELKNALNEHTNKYGENLQSEEALAELAGIIATNYNALNAEDRSALRKLIDYIAKNLKNIGFNITTDEDVIDLMNTVAGKIATGDVISQEDVQLLNGANGTVVKNIDEATVRESRYTESDLKRFKTNSNTTVRKVKTTTLAGKRVSVIESDRMVGGKFGRNTFLGGIYYPIITGRVWASDDQIVAQNIVDQLVRDEDGYYYLIPAVMSDTSHLSNRNMMKIIFQYFEDAIKTGDVDIALIRERVSKVLETKKTSKKKDGTRKVTMDLTKYKQGALNAIDTADSPKDSINALLEYIFDNEFSFDERKEFVVKLLGKAKSQTKTNFYEAVGTVETIGKVFADPDLEGVGIREATTVIRFKDKPVVKKTPKKDKFYHTSYEYHIEDGKQEVLFLDKVIDVTKAIPEFTTMGGKKYSAKQALKKAKKSGDSISKALTNLFRTMRMSKFSAPLTTDTELLTSREQREALETEEKNTIPKKLPKAPKKTVKAYKLFTLGSDNKLYPLFVRANEPVSENEWIEAQMGEVTKEGKVKSKIGKLALRGGWHAGDYIAANHIGGKSRTDLNKPDYRPATQIWAEVELPNDKDWQSVANSRARRTKAGKIDVKTAHITDQVPEGGHYRYKTNPNMQGNWLIGGAMKVTKRLNKAQTKKIQDDTEIYDLPTLPEIIEQDNLSFNDLSLTAQKELQQYYPDVYKKLTGGVSTREQRINQPIEFRGESVSLGVIRDKLYVDNEYTFTYRELQSVAKQLPELKGLANMPKEDLQEEVLDLLIKIEDGYSDKELRLLYPREQKVNPEKIKDITKNIKKENTRTATEGERIIGVSRAEVNKVRRGMDLYQFSPPERKAQFEMLNNAKEKGFDKNAPELLNSIFEKPRPLTDNEVAGLALYLAELSSRKRDAQNKRNEALEQNDMITVAEQSSVIIGADKSISEAHSIIEMARTEAGRGLAALGILISEEEFDPVSVKNTARDIVQNRELTEKEDSDLTTQAENIQKKEKIYKEKESKVSRLEKQLDELKNQYLGKYRKVKKPRKLPTEEEAALIEQIKIMRKRLRLEDSLASVNEDIRLLKEGRIDEMEIFKQTSKKRRNELSQERTELYQAKAKLRRYLYKMRGFKYDFWGKSMDFFRAMKLSFDMGYFGRQGGLALLSRPKQALKVFGDTFPSFFSDSSFLSIDDSIKRSKNYKKAKTAKLAILDIDIEFHKQLEGFNSKLADRIPWVRASNRHYITGLNLLRMTMFDDFVRKNPTASPEVLENYAKFVNEYTGRGSLGSFETSAKGLATWLMAPRWVTANWQRMIQARHMWTTDQFGRRTFDKTLAKEIASEWMKVYLGFSAVAAGFIFSGFKLGLDPEEPDFLKFRKDDLVIDVTGGLAGNLRIPILMAEVGLATAGAGKLENRANFKSILQNYGTYKFAPSATIPFEFITGQNVVGDERTYIETMYNLFTPIVVETVIQDIQEGKDFNQSVLENSPELFGFGTQSYSEKTQRGRFF